PSLGVPPDELDAPGERFGAGACHAGLYEGVEDHALGLTEPGHDRKRQRGEGLPGATALSAPGDFLLGRVLELTRDADALLASSFTELLDAPGLRRRSFGRGRVVWELRRSQPADD